VKNITGFLVGSASKRYNVGQFWEQSHKARVHLRLDAPPAQPSAAYASAYADLTLRLAARVRTLCVTVRPVERLTPAEEARFTAPLRAAANATVVFFRDRAFR
jgi:hypothetical protein